MDEQVLIKGKSTKNLVLVSVGLIIGIFALIFFFVSINKDYVTDYIMGRTYPKNGDYYFYEASKMMGFVQKDARNAIITLIIAILTLPTSILLFLASNCDITLTDKAIYGKASFGKQVSIPLKTITAVSLKSFDGLCISSFAGNTIFRGIQNKQEFFNAITKILIERE